MSINGKLVNPEQLYQVLVKLVPEDVSIKGKEVSEVQLNHELIKLLPPIKVASKLFKLIQPLNPELQSAIILLGAEPTATTIFLYVALLLMIGLKYVPVICLNRTVCGLALVNVCTAVVSVSTVPSPQSTITVPSVPKLGRAKSEPTMRQFHQPSFSTTELISFWLMLRG